MTKSQQHDRIYNEGGEGYNPHHKQQVSAEPRIWTLRGQRDRLLRMMESTSTADPRYAEYAAALVAVQAEINTAEAQGE